MLHKLPFIEEAFGGMCVPEIASTFRRVPDSQSLGGLICTMFLLVMAPCMSKLLVLSRVLLFLTKFSTPVDSEDVWTRSARKISVLVWRIGGFGSTAWEMRIANMNGVMIVLEERW